MTLIKWKNGTSGNGNLNTVFQNSNPALFGTRSLFDSFNYPFEGVRLFQNLLDDDLGISGNSIGKTLPAVNITESMDAITIEVAAPGLKKKDFNIELNENQLRIGYAHENQEKESEGKNVWRREYRFESFERVFTVPETVNGENITASYEDGILKIVAPKKEEAKKKPARSIMIK